MKAEDYIYALKAGADLEFNSQEIASDGKLNFRDSGIYLQSGADGKLTIAADGTGSDDITLSGTVNIDDEVLLDGAKKVQFRDTGLYINSGANGKMTISADGTGTDDITLSGHVTAGGLVLGHTAYTNSDSGSTASIDSFFINVDPTAGSTTIDLPTAGAVAGKVFVVQDSGGTANSNNITVATEGSENIDGSATATIAANYGALRVYSDGSDFFSF